MALFSVYYDEKDNQEIRRLVTSLYKNHFFVYNGYCLIEAPNTSAFVIAKELKIWDDDTEKSSHYGIVLKLNGSYSGYADGEIWNFLEKGQTS